MMGTPSVRNTEFLFLVIGWDRDVLVIKGFRNLVGANAFGTHLEHTEHITCRRLVTGQAASFRLYL